MRSWKYQINNKTSENVEIFEDIFENVTCLGKYYQMIRTGLKKFKVIRSSKFQGVCQKF